MHKCHIKEQFQQDCGKKRHTLDGMWRLRLMEGATMFHLLLLRGRVVVVNVGRM